MNGLDVAFITNCDGMISIGITALHAGERWHEKLILLPATAAQGTVRAHSITTVPCLFKIELGVRQHFVIIGRSTYPGWFKEPIIGR